MCDTGVDFDGDVLMAIKQIAIKDGTDEANAVLLKALLSLATEWNLSHASLAQLLRKDRSRISAWQSAGRLPANLSPAAREQIQHLLAIYRSLATMFRRSQDQALWLNTAHPVLGKPPLELMKSSIRGLIEVRAYLDYARGRGA